MARRAGGGSMTNNANLIVDDLMKIYNWLIEQPQNRGMFPVAIDDAATLCLMAADMITTLSIAAEKASAKDALYEYALAVCAKAQKEAEQMKASRDYWQQKAIAAEDRLQAIQEAEDEFMLCYGY